MNTIKKKRPVLILGGTENALSIARSLGKRGIDIYLSVLNKNCAYYTRHCRKLFPFEDKKEIDAFWSDLLLSDKIKELRGCVIFPCNDDGVQFIAKYHSELKKYYLLDDSDPKMMLTMLSKLKTLELAKSIGIPIPNYIIVENFNHMDNIHLDLKYPVIIKPIYSHIFQKEFNGDKFFFVQDEDELYQKLEKVYQHELEIIISELIPGPDTLLGSYYTYIDRNGKSLFDFTKGIIRRYPVNKGLATYHVTHWNEEIAALGRKFFSESDFKGLGNVEFKRDTRDGKLKLIECNPRFTAAQELLTVCGMDIALIIYNHLTGHLVPKIDNYEENMTLWYPYRDYMAFKQLRSQNEITFFEWAKSIARKQVFPHFKMTDPMPVLAPFLNSVTRKIFGK